MPENIGKYWGNGNPIEFKQHPPWKTDILSNSEMVRKVSISFKQLEKMNVENNNSKFISPNVGSFLDLLGQFSMIYTTLATFTKKMWQI